jgi:hypothetical protein
MERVIAGKSGDLEVAKKKEVSQLTFQETSQHRR